MLPYPDMEFTAFDQLPASDLNKLVDNIESLSDGSGIEDGSITTNKLKNDYMFSVTRAASANTGNNAFAILSFDTEVYDYNNNFASGAYTAPVTGVYWFSWSVAISNSGTNQDTVTSLFVNGNRHKDGTRDRSTNLTVTSQGSVEIPLAAGDVVDIRTQCTTAQPITINSINTYFMGSFRAQGE